MTNVVKQLLRRIDAQKSEIKWTLAGPAAALLLALMVAIGCGSPTYQNAGGGQFSEATNLWRIAPDRVTLIGSFTTLNECGERGRTLMVQRSKGDFREYICLDASWRPKER